MVKIPSAKIPSAKFLQRRVQHSASDRTLAKVERTKTNGIV